MPEMTEAEINALSWTHPDVLKCVEESMAHIDPYIVKYWPEYMRNGVRLYIRDGICTGDFLTAFFSNDLKEAVGRADQYNKNHLPDYVEFMYNRAPIGCWASVERFQGWRREHGMHGRCLAMLKEHLKRVLADAKNARALQPE